MKTLTGAGMSIMKPTECQEHALACARLAQSAKSPRERDILYAMSKSWQTLANQAMRYEQAQEKGEDL
jgi:hypothetical protein